MTKKPKLMHVVGARPNFPKVAPILAEVSTRLDHFDQVLVHTGQHYDYNMSQVFFEHLGMPDPDEFLNVGSGSHAVQTAAVMTGFEQVVLRHRPDWVVVVGDVNSTLACALVCSKLGIRVAHVEAGLRSRDRSMPEEINRVLTDQISDLLLTSCREADANLVAEGIDKGRIRFVGNTMIDSLAKMLPIAANRSTLTDLGLSPKQFILATLHRPANVDDPTTLREISNALVQLSNSLPVLFPIHPRTRARLEGLDLLAANSQLRVMDPLGYLDFLAVMASAALVVTDSGGIQEETTYLGIPCLTVRPNTERPITITHGTNRLVPGVAELIHAAAQKALETPSLEKKSLELWDGRASKRIVDAFEQ